MRQQHFYKIRIETAPIYRGVSNPRTSALCECYML